MLFFFEQPIALYAMERELFRYRYVTLIKTGLVQAMVNNQWELTQKIMERWIPDDLQVVFKVSSNHWGYFPDEALAPHPLRKYCFF